MNNIITRSLISGLVAGVIWLSIFVLFFVIILRFILSSSGNYAAIDDAFLYRLSIMAGTVFLMGFACVAPAKYYAVKKLQDENYKMTRTYLLSSILSIVLILVMTIITPTKQGISSFAKEPGGAIFLSIMFGFLLPFFGHMTLPKIDKLTGWRSSDKDT